MKIPRNAEKFINVCGKFECAGPDTNSACKFQEFCLEYAMFIDVANEDSFNREMEEAIKKAKAREVR